jgi:hypothetical protein
MNAGGLFNHGVSPFLLRLATGLPRKFSGARKHRLFAIAPTARVSHENVHTVRSIFSFNADELKIEKWIGVST